MSRHLVIGIAVVGLSLTSIHLSTRSQAQEKSAQDKTVVITKPSAEMLAMQKILSQPIDTKGLREKAKFKEAIDYLSEQLSVKPIILIDREAFANELGADAPDPYEEEVSLPPIPAKLPLNVALRYLAMQVGRGNATFIVRRNFIEITTRQSATAAYTMRQTISFLSFDQRPLPEILGNLADDYSVAINIDPALGKAGMMPITATFRNCSLEEALVTVTEMAELKFVVLEHSVYVTTPDKAAVLRREEERRAEDRKELKIRRLEPAM